MSAWSNIGNVARREYLVRVRTRSFLIGTLLLVAGVVAIAFLPVIIRSFDRVDTTDLAVVTEEQAMGPQAVATLSLLLNAPTGAGSADPGATADYVVTEVATTDAARTGVTAGTYDAALAIHRGEDGELSFVLFSDDPATGRTAALVRQATSALAIADRLERLGVAPAAQAGLFAPASFDVQWPDPSRTDPTRDSQAAVGQDMLAFGMTILIFMIIVMYGNWIAMSVVEEKTSRVMEVILNAATPFQLLAGKVFGVGAVAFTQYAAIVVTGGLALVLVDPVSALALGQADGGLELTQGLSPAMLLAFAAYGLLGFLLYASLFAAAASLVSRQEDVNSAVMPLTLLSTAGYMVGVYAAMGLLDIKAGWITALTQVPLVTPFMMLGRLAVGAASPIEVVVSLAGMVLAIGVAIWIAARIYAVGVLLYGSRPGAKAVWRLLREGM